VTPLEDMKLIASLRNQLAEAEAWIASQKADIERIYKAQLDAEQDLYRLLETIKHQGQMSDLETRLYFALLGAKSVLRPKNDREVSILALVTKTVALYRDTKDPPPGKLESPMDWSSVPGMSD